MKHLSSFELTSTLWKKWKSQLLALPPIFLFFTLLLCSHCNIPLPSSFSWLITLHMFLILYVLITSGILLYFLISPSYTFFNLFFSIVIGFFPSISKNVQVYFTFKKLPSIFLPLQYNFLPFFPPQYKKFLQDQIYIHFLSYFMLPHSIYSQNPYSLVSHNDHQH